MKKELVVVEEVVEEEEVVVVEEVDMPVEQEEDTPVEEEEAKGSAPLLVGLYPAPLSRPASTGPLQNKD